ncbi:MAG: O-antigen ligase family protein [Deltaproteobacteria bacterium]|nr:O-antigen ligase family protein [Deltaproteobacteria bacterium]
MPGALDAAPQPLLVGAASTRRPALAAVASLSMIVWVLGTLLGEGLAQAGAGLALLLGLVAWKQLRIPKDLRAFAALTLALVAYQALSPFLALAIGNASELPRSGRWTQALDTLAPLSLAAISTFGVPWAALAWTLGIGWLAEAAVASFQIAVPWPWASLGPFKFPMDRLHEDFARDFGGPVKRAGIGLFFHRLRFAHGAAAMAGPALALTLMSSTFRRRALAAAALVVVLGCAYLSYARAALGAALVAVVVGLASLLSGRQRLASAAAVALLAAGALALSPTWRQRAANAWLNLQEGERAMALQTGWKIVQEHPVLGVGFGGYGGAAKAHLQPDWPEWTRTILQTSAHNVALTVWAETGIFGLALYLAQQLALALALWRRARGRSIAAAGALLSLIAFHLLGLVHYTQFHTGVALTFALLWGLGLASPGVAATTADEPESPHRVGE